MFAEFVYFALAVFLILCGGKDDHIRYDTSFDTLLGMLTVFLQYRVSHNRVPKTRPKYAPLVLPWFYFGSTLVPLVIILPS